MPSHTLSLCQLAECVLIDVCPTHTKLDTRPHQEVLVSPLTVCTILCHEGGEETNSLDEWEHKWRSTKQLGLLEHAGRGVNHHCIVFTI